MTTPSGPTAFGSGVVGFKNPGIITANQVIIVGSNGELLVYNVNPPVQGSLVDSIAALAGFDSLTPADAVIQGVATYNSPGLGIAAALQNGQLALFTGPVSGGGPWTQQGGIGISGTNDTGISAGNNGAILLNSGFPAGRANIQLDGFPYGGQRASILEANSPESYTNTTLTASPNLQVTGLKNPGIYHFHLNLIFDGASSGGGLKWKVVYNSTAPTGHANQIFEGTTGVTIFNGDTFSTGLAGHAAQTVGVGSFLGLIIDGDMALPTGTNAVTMQFAQNTSSATATKIYSGSYMSLENVG